MGELQWRSGNAPFSDFGQSLLVRDVETLMLAVSEIGYKVESINSQIGRLSESPVVVEQTAPTTSGQPGGITLPFTAQGALLTRAVTGEPIQIPRPGNADGTVPSTYDGWVLAYADPNSNNLFGWTQHLTLGDSTNGRGGLTVNFKAGGFFEISPASRTLTWLTQAGRSIGFSDDAALIAYRGSIQIRVSAADIAAYTSSTSVRFQEVYLVTPEGYPSRVLMLMSSVL